MKLKIKSKLIAGSLAMAIILLSSSAGVVAVIVGKQTRASIDQTLTRTTNIIKDELLAHQNLITGECRRLISSSDMASEIKFLHEHPGKESISTTKSTFIGNTEKLFQSTSTNRFSSMATYDIDGNLATFVVQQKEGQYLAGFNLVDKSSSSFVGGEFSGDDRLSGDRFLENAPQPDVEIKLDFSNIDSSHESSHFTVKKSSLALRVSMPLMGNAYNPVTENVEPAPVGILVAYYNISDAFAEKIKKVTETDINIYVDERYVAGTVQKHKGYESKEPFKESGDLAAQKIYIDGFQLGDEKYFHALLPLFDSGRLIGALAAIQSGQLIFMNIKNILIQLTIVNIISVFLLLPVIYFLSMRLSNPLKAVVSRLKDIAEGEGDLTMRLEKRSDDEIGELAQWFNLFIDKLQGIIGQIAENSHNLNLSSQDMARLSGQMSGNSSDMVRHLNETAASVEGVNENFISVAAAMEESSTNLGMIVAASEEMAVTINEVSGKTANAGRVSKDAVARAGNISGLIKELGTAAQKIGKVTDMINEISDQTNLLALNATIEAARAGEAGKGFTVVAGEIKELAKQTAVATKDIQEQIDGIQQSTAKTTADIEEILSVINIVNETVISIASDVEEQSCATQEINRNVAHASQGISDVNQNIAHNSAMVTKINGNISNIDGLARNIANRSGDVSSGARALFTLSEELHELVKRFKI